ncbi:MAG: type 4a pilus biogenesis protein PilO [Candidatus Saccharimonadia bacterium]
MKMPKTNNNLWAYLIVAVIVGVGAYFIAKPLYDGAQSQKTLAASIQVNINALKILKTETETLRTNFATVSKDQTRILQALPEKSQEELLLPQMINIASSTGVGLSGLTIAPVEQGIVVAATPGNNIPVGLLAYPFTFTITGNYSNLNNFFGALKLSARYVDVQSIDLSSENNNPNNLSMKVILNAYYQSNGGTN